MAYELKQELKLTQSLVMTPQLQLAIRLLQLSRLELVDMLREEVQVNPVLEENVDAEPAETPVMNEETGKEEPKPWDNLEAYAGANDRDGKRRLDFNASTEDDDADSMLNSAGPSGTSLCEHLMWQIKMQGLPVELQGAAEFIIGNIDEDGYLRIVEREDLSDSEVEEAAAREIAAHTGVTEAQVEEALGVIQHLDPVGAGARTLRECLLLQARALPVRDTVVEEIVGGHLHDLANKNFKAIARELSIGVDEVTEAARFINRSLNPTPGRGFGKEERGAIVPDIHIHRVGDEYVITMNEDGLPKLRISAHYRQMLKSAGVSEETKSYIQDKFRSALWLIKSMHQRQRTIYRVVECLVKFQREFLDKGLKFLKPLVLKDIAAEIGVHESTVSRVTSNKYVQTPRGIFELKYFFSSGLSSSDGADLATEYIREKVKDIIKSEDAKSPLSDKEIVDRLKRSGIVLARRTVAKYREALGLLSSSRRKSFY